jgi:ParB/RepB/Spo0J family partition protein
LVYRDPEGVDEAMKVKKYNQQLSVSGIRISPFHFRKESAQERIEELATSIVELGLIHAVSVVEDPSGGYELINGHRRLLAHKHAKLKTIRSTVYEYEPHELADETVRRQSIAQFLLAANSAEPLIPVERARYWEQAMEKFAWDTADIARVHHVDEAQVIDDLMYLNLQDEVLKMVQAHPDSFSTEHLRILAEYSTPSAAKAWVMTPEEQVRVARELADQRDKKIVASPRAFRTHIQAEVKKRRNEAAAAKRRLGGGTEDPVKALYKLLGGVHKSIDTLVKADLSSIKEIDPADKGKAAQDIYGMAQQLIDFAEGPLQRLKTRQPAKAKATKAAAA